MLIGNRQAALRTEQVIIGKRSLMRPPQPNRRFFDGADKRPLQLLWPPSFARLFILSAVLLAFVNLFHPRKAEAQSGIPNNPDDAVAWLQDEGNTCYRNDDGEVIRVTIDYLPRIFVVGDLDVFPQLEELHVNYTGNFFDYHMSGIARLQNLKSVYFYRCTSISDATLGALRYLPKLENVRVKNCPSISSLAPLNACPNVKQFEFADMRKFDFDDLERLSLLSKLESLELNDLSSLLDQHAKYFSKAGNLKKLRISRCNKISDQFLNVISEMPQLEELELHQCSGLTGNFLTQLPKSIKRLQLHYLSIEPSSFGKIGALTNLESLDVYNSLKQSKDSVEPDWSIIGKLKTLEFIRLPRIEIDDEQLQQWNGLTELESLDLSGSTNFDGHGLDMLQNCKQLKRLDLSDCKHFDSKDLPRLAECTKLKQLFLRHTNIGTKNFATLAELPELETLTLDGCKRVGDEAIEILSHSRSLKSIRLQDLSRISDRAIQSLARTKTLTELSFANNVKITGSGFAVYSLDSKIERLDFRKVPNLTPEGLANLQRLKNLSYLRVEDFKTTNEHVLSLKHHPSLTYAYFSRTSELDPSVLRRFQNSINDR